MALNQQEFLNRCAEIHGNKFDYSKLVYIRGKDKVCIICPEHGEFWQSPGNHTHSNNAQGCPTCGKIFGTKKRTLTKKEFIQKAKLIHGKKYKYSKVEYVNTKNKVCIICPEHGEFWQSPGNHIHSVKKYGCFQCGHNGDNKRLTKEEFIEKSKVKHGDFYDYSKVEYVRNDIKVCIICPEHGKFWQTPNVHSRGSGCNLCSIGKRWGLYNEKTFDDNPDWKNKICIFYFLEFDKFLKIGITINSIKQRFWSEGLKYKILKSKSMNLYEAFCLEKEMKIKYRLFRYTGKPFKNGGKTECFQKRIKCDIMDYLK